MRSIFIIDTYYQSVIDSLGFGEGVTLPTSYREAIEELTQHGFGTGGAYRKELMNLGWEAEIVVPNSFATQAKWLQENKFSKPISKGWTYGLHVARAPGIRRFSHLLPHIQGTLYKQIATLKPDVVFVQDLNVLTPTLAKKIRQHTKLLVGEIASPLPPKAYFEQYDLIFSALPTIVDQTKKWGIDSKYLPLGFDSRWASHSLTPVSERTIDAIFVGSFSRHQPQTIPLLQEVAKLVPSLEIYGSAKPEVLKDAGLLNNYRGKAWGEDMFKLLANSKIVINRHGTIAGDFAVNMRMFETTGCGAVLVTEHKSNIADLFEPGVEVLTYENATDAAAQVKDLLSDEKRLNAIATAGQQKTLSSHTYNKRAKQLSELLASRLP